MSTDEITLIKRYFDSKHVLLCPAWLHEAVKWCKEECLGSNYTIEQLKYKIFEQWTLLDLRDVEVPVLPPGLATVKKTTLNGSYSLQMMKVVDISKPKYWQLQKIRCETPKNLDKDETVSAKRVLLLTLTDGVQEIEAMEFKPIRDLSLNLTPGVKIKITGPVDVRRGRMMLEERHIKVIGGEVDSLLVQNAAENVLAERLELPLNPNPKSVQEAAFVEETTSLSMSNFSTQATQPVPIRVNNMDEQQIDREIDELLEVEREMEMMQAPKRHEVTSDMFEDDLDFENIEIPTENLTQNHNDPIENLESEVDLFENINLEAHLNELDKKMNDSPITISRLLTEKLYGTFRIRAKYKSIVERLTLLNDKYYLVIEIEDGTESLITRVHNDVLAQWARCTTMEFISLKEAYQNNVPGAPAKVLEVMKALKGNLESLDCTVEVEVSEKEKYANLIGVVL